MANNTLTEKEKQHLATLAKLEKDHGKGTVILASEEAKDVKAISTGSISLDRATGIGGIPEGRIIEIYGPESSGKTTLALHMCKEAQIKYPDKWVAFIDMEHALDLNYAEAIGINLQKLHISQPGYGEEAMNIAEALIKTQMYPVIVVDSVAALITKKEMDGAIGDSAMGGQARLMSQSMRSLSPLTGPNGTTLIFINQIREKIGVMFGSPETTPGGNALKFFASMRFDIRKKQSNKEAGATEDDDFISNTVKVKIVKNKMSAPFRKCEFNIEFGIGIDKVREVFNEAVDANIIAKAGSWYSYEGNRLGQGAESVMTLLHDNIEMVLEIENKLKSTTSDESQNQEAPSQSPTA